MKMPGNNNKGFMTIEASVVVPVVLFGVFTCIFGLIHAYERGYTMTGEYEALYEIPFNDVRNETSAGFLSGREYDKGIINGSLSVSCGYAGDKATCDGDLELFGNTKIKGEREIDVCVDRLRRWQLYDDIVQE